MYKIDGSLQRQVIDIINQWLRSSEEEVLLIAIDGKCGSGKTTLSEFLKEYYACNVFHMDDFFLQQHQRTEERLTEIGGNVDYERFQDEVLQKIKNKEMVLYRAYSCKEKKLGDSVSIHPHRLNIIEGSYSQHPFFGDAYQLRIFLDLEDNIQVNNIRNRNGEEKLLEFQKLWIPKENAYFDTYHIKQKSIVIKGYEINRNT